MLLELESIIVNEKPTYLLVYGDTNSTLAGALVASKLHIPLVHVESGLRSHNLEMPEEMNRILTDRMASILFTPTQQASENLIYEGFERFGCIVENVGDVMYDALLMFKSKGLWRPSMGPVSIFKEPFALATFHRFENVKNPFRLERIVREINDVHENFLPVWLPIHPSTKKILAEHNLELKCYTAPPASYFEMLFALEKCSIVLTDSGGLQKEAYFMQRPCITLRTETEWVELLSVGANTLFDLGKDRGLREKVKSMLLKVIDYSEQFYGDGSAAHKIAHTLAQTKLR
jgi:UDP-GlcNAc3NAcA epimerase